MRALREPLLHFAAIGIVLFAADRLVQRKRPTPPPPAVSAPAARIVVTEQVRRAVEADFTRAHGRAPTAPELAAAIEAWIDDEILYREGVARGFAESDPRVRQRIAEQMAFVLSSSAVVPEPTDDELRAWFATNKAKWATAPLVDFTQVFVQGTDTAARARADALLAELKGGADPAGLGDVFSGGRRYRRRTVADLTSAFGPEFVAGIGAQQAGTWAVRASRPGYHVVRIDAHTPGGEPDFASVKELVKLDRDKSLRESAARAALKDLRARFTIEGLP